MILILCIILSIYYIAILSLIYGFTTVNSFNALGLQPKTKFSIVVPFRNETENLPVLLNSFSKLNYPPEMFEVLLVDDGSEEVASIPCSVFNVQIIKNIRFSNSPKKDAISTAIKVVKNDWIITTDADCVVSENWLSLLDNYIQSHQEVSMIAGAVRYSCINSFLHQFQQLDLASLQGATIGSFGLHKGFMCNGANFSYTKSFFQELNGFVGNDNIASGDDVFLLQKAITQFPEKVHYLKSEYNIVTTKPCGSWHSLFYQRVRWASKTGSYQSSFGIGLGLVVFGGNVGFLCVICGFLFRVGNPYVLIILLVGKILIDYFLIDKMSTFLKNKMQFYLVSSLLYPIFSVVVALYSLVGKYEWKGRWF